MRHNLIKNSTHPKRVKLASVFKDNLSPEVQIAKIDAILNTVHKESPKNWVWIDRGIWRGLTCYTIALGLGNSKVYLRKAKINFNLILTSKSIEKAIDEEFLEEILEPINNCLILYFDEEDNPKHAGIISKNKKNCHVESQWGMLPAIFSHQIEDVPGKYKNEIGYGCKVGYFKLPTLSEIEKYFNISP